MSYEVGWWRTKKDDERRRDHYLALADEREAARLRKERFQKIILPVLAGLAAASLMALIL